MGQFSGIHNTQRAQLATPRLKFQKRFASLHAAATTGCAAAAVRSAGSLLQPAGTPHLSGLTFSVCSFQQVDISSPKINLFK